MIPNLLRYAYNQIDIQYDNISVLQTCFRMLIRYFAQMKSISRVLLNVEIEIAQVHVIVSFILYSTFRSSK